MGRHLGAAAKDSLGVAQLVRHGDPLCEKLFVARGTIVAGIGYKDENCTEGAFFEVADAKRFYECSLQVGNHVPLVYGDVYDNAVALAKLLGLEVLTCE